MTGVTCICQKDSEPRIPRPKNAFILFRMNYQHNLPASVPNTEKSKILASTWNNMPSTERKHWEEVAAEERRKHKLLYPNYVYNKPRELQKKQLPKKSKKGKFICTCKTPEKVTSITSQVYSSPPFSVPRVEDNTVGSSDRIPTLPMPLPHQPQFTSFYGQPVIQTPTAVYPSGLPSSQPLHYVFGESGLAPVWHSNSGSTKDPSMVTFPTAPYQTPPHGTVFPSIPTAAYQTPPHGTVLPSIPTGVPILPPLHTLFN